MKADILLLGETPGSPNPCQAMSIEVEMNGARPQVIAQSP